MKEIYQGKVSSKYQLTLPVEARKVLGIKAGDTVNYEILDDGLKISVVRPDIDAVIDDVLAENDFSALAKLAKNDAKTYVSDLRGKDD